ncbi:bifunctional glycosyltransferase family 2 protein/CDP-glycerol:glycerophosphate glycerophosphotransferase [Streptomyces sp. ODS28]|uniref:bifunctional glycosyltransferase/CDP-glycerol:glycerophosphate glycerophosphotransferase n=1 Tax=Streptomyces sp. ODS28 TaxID=3136688 RepID=UPI0031F0F677
MPRFSVIVPCFKVQGYLRECLDSVLSQSFGDIEVIGVNDCSPDGSGRILDEYAERDARMKVLHLPENVGLGRARNAGVAEATGEYLLFLDSDDTYLPGSLEAIDAQLTACETPDVLVFDHQRSYWWGGIRPSDFGEMLAETGTETYTVAERPELLHLFHVAWNKAYRREFYLRNELTFEPGLYEDAPLSNEAMVTAEAVGCLSFVAVDYRQRYQGAITRSPGRKHFDIFPQYDSQFVFLDKRPELEPMRPLLFERMISHLLFCVRKADRVNPSDRKDFFRQASALYNKHKPAGYRPEDFHPTKESVADFALLARGSFTQFMARWRAQQVKRALPHRVRKTKVKVGKKAYQRYYQMQRKLPLDENLALYSAYWDRGVSCNPAAIAEKAKELAPQVHPVWVVRPSAVAALPPGTDYVLPHSRRYWEVLARAKYLVNNVNFADHWVKRPGQVHLQTHHGTPLKTMGLDQQKFPAAGKGMSFRKLLQRAARWDISISSNPHTTEVWDRVYPTPYEHLESGYPRNDVYTSATGEDVARIRAELGIPQGRKALLYAPTMRDYRKGFMPVLDMERLSNELGDEYVLLVRTHYFYGDNRALQDLQERGLIMDVSRHPSTEELCLASDALITDYSSIMFDYANLDRPIVIYAPDWETYRNSRGTYFDLLSGQPGETPGAFARSDEELAEAFLSGRWNGREAARLRTAFRERFCTFDDGRAAERAVRRFFLKEDTAALPPVIPLAERTPAPLPEPADESEEEPHPALRGS